MEDPSRVHAGSRSHAMPVVMWIQCPPGGCWAAKGPRRGAGVEEATTVRSLWNLTANDLDARDDLAFESLVHDVHARDDLSEDGVVVVEAPVVDEVHEELRIAGVVP